MTRSSHAMYPNNLLGMKRGMRRLRARCACPIKMMNGWLVFIWKKEREWGNTEEEMERKLLCVTCNATSQLSFGSKKFSFFLILCIMENIWDLLKNEDVICQLKVGHHQAIQLFHYSLEFKLLGLHVKSFERRVFWLNSPYSTTLH